MSQPVEEMKTFKVSYASYYFSSGDQCTKKITIFYKLEKQFSIKVNKYRIS